MKYWIFQNNQVLGPYEPEDLGRTPSFGAESLVCPEGRKGTSMGDWQRAGMVPDLSIVLLKTAQAQNVAGPVASLAGFSPEPTLKDLAVLSSLQEKMTMMEGVVLQLQESSRLKDAELAKLHEELAGKTQESSAIKKDAEQLHLEAEARRHEAAALKAEAVEFKGKISELEERAAAINRLSETLDRTVEAEKHVEHDVQAHGATLSELAREIDSLRSQLKDRLDSASASASVAASAPQGLPEFSFAAPPAPTQIEVQPAPEAVLPVERPSSEDAPVEAPPAPEDVPAATPPPPRKTKALLMGGASGLAALTALAFFSGRLPVKRTHAPPEPPAESAPEPIPPSAVETPAPTPSVIDEREAAVDLAKRWPLRNGTALGQALETLSPPAGHLSSWMAEPLSNGRVQVNYFARSASPGSPTVAYEFEVDLTSQSLSARNAAAKAVVAGKAAPPPPPKKAKAVRVKAKKTTPTNATVSTSGETPAPAPETVPAPAPETAPTQTAEAAPVAPPPPAKSTENSEPLLPGFSAKPASADASPDASKPKPAKRSKTDSSKTEPRPDKTAEDASLLDDLLKE